MFDIDILKSQTVRVNGGSGVLIRPLSPDCLYVLTAYHCIMQNPDNPIINVAYGKYRGIVPNVLGRFCNKEADAAIIIIERFCDDLQFIGLRDRQGEYVVDYPHLGYPKCREHTDDQSRDIAGRAVKRLWGKDNDFFEEYEYEKNVVKDELEGMSGGGIFDQNYHLLGVHKGSKVKDEDEQLGHALYIPSRHFQGIIKKNGLPEVIELDLSSFVDIKDDIFDLSNKQGAKNKTQELLTSMAIKLAAIVNLSPVELYNAFNDARNGCKPVPFGDLLKHDWASFGEFVLVTSIMMNVDLSQELDKIISEFQYVHSDKDLDLENVANELDQRLIGYIRPGMKIVIGGISDSGFLNDVKSYKLTPDIANALPVEGFDVAKSPRQLMQAFTYVNVNLYKEAIIQRCNEIRDCEEDKLNFYISIIKKAIYESEG